MNKRTKRIIALALTISAFSAIEPTKYFNLMTTKAYASSDDGCLDDLDISKGKLNFSRSKTKYTTKVSSSVDEITITARAKSDKDKVKIDGSDVSLDSRNEAEETVKLKKGRNLIKVKVETSDGSKTYYLTINRGSKSSSKHDDDDDDVFLDNITLSDGNISFKKKTSSYDVNVPSSVKEIKIKAQPEYDDNRVEINGKEVDKDDKYKETVDLENGKNEVKIEVEDEDGDNSRTYTLNIYRGGSSSTTSNYKIDNKQDDIYLDDLILNDGDVKVNYKPKVTAYDVNVGENCDSIIVKAEPEDDDNIVRINDDKADSKSRKRVSLDKGKNVIKIMVSSENEYDKDDDDYEQRIYTLNVYRGTKAPSTNTDNTESKSNVSSKWVTVNGRWQYNDALGNPLKNTWYYDSNYGKNYYMQADGYMATGWLSNNNSWYFLDASGAMQTGWKQIGTNWYYLDDSGKMKTGWFRDMNGAYYYLSSTGAMATNTTIDGYKLGINGAWIR